MKTLGIIGGMGPLAGAVFFKKLVELTPAEADQQHIPAILINDVLIPDRTDYILDPSKPSPLPRLTEDIRKLEMLGADCIAIPCNTAHYFYDTLQSVSSVPVINILEATVRPICADGKKHKAAILATSGSLKSGVYNRTLEKYSVEPYIPPESICSKVSELIYSQVKSGEKGDEAAFLSVIDAVLDAGCDSVILGCTELSVIYDGIKNKPEKVFDSTELLASECVRYCMT